MAMYIGLTFKLNCLFILYHTGAVILPYYSYQSYSHPVYIYDLNCTGIEDSVWGCSHNKNIQYCRPNYDASVLCQRE